MTTNALGLETVRGSTFAAVKRKLHDRGFTILPYVSYVETIRALRGKARLVVGHAYGTHGRRYVVFVRRWILHAFLLECLEGGADRSPGVFVAVLAAESFIARVHACRRSHAVRCATSVEYAAAMQDAALRERVRNLLREAHAEDFDLHMEAFA